MNIERLKEIFNNYEEEKRILAEPIIKETENLIKQLEDIKKFSFFRVSENGKILKITEASKLYKDLLNSLNMNIKTLYQLLGKGEKEELSFLEEYLKNQEK